MTDWIKKNLFSTPFNSFLTIISVVLIFYTVPSAIAWVFINAVWIGGPQECIAQIQGACWPFIAAKFNQFIYGFYTESERWRVNILGIILFTGIAMLVIDKVPRKKAIGIFMITVFPILSYFLLNGGYFGLLKVPTEKWGGLLLTMVISLVGIVLSMPFGVILALGRRSQMPFIRSVCVVFIEFWRGIPLITVLFMASVMLPLFLSKGVHFDQLLRALLGVAIFASAYMAEVIRGGLQAVPKGQYEAAEALGLSYFHKMTFIVLPQALKIVIPGIVNSFIALFKDTTLVLIISLFDLLGVIQAGIKDPKWLAYSTPYTGYVFAALVFFIFCYGMSLYSKKIEKKLRTSHNK